MSKARPRCHLGDVAFEITKVSHPYFMGTLGLKCFVIAHKYKKLTLT